MQNRAGAGGVQKTEKISDIMIPDQLAEEFAQPPFQSTFNTEKRHEENSAHASLKYENERNTKTLYETGCIKRTHTATFFYNYI